MAVVFATAFGTATVFSSCGEDSTSVDSIQDSVVMDSTSDPAVTDSTVVE